MNERYQAIKSMIRKYLFIYHPDYYTGSNPDTAQQITRWLIDFNQRVDKIYQRLNSL